MPVMQLFCRIEAGTDHIGACKAGIAAAPEGFIPIPPRLAVSSPNGQRGDSKIPRSPLAMSPPSVRQAKAFFHMGTTTFETNFRYAPWRVIVVRLHLNLCKHPSLIRSVVQVWEHIQS